mgnify:CR=1 FL=1|jgi:hypothetical protein
MKRNGSSKLATTNIKGEDSWSWWIYIFVMNFLYTNLTYFLFYSLSSDPAASSCGGFISSTNCSTLLRYHQIRRNHGDSLSTWLLSSKLFWSSCALVGVGRLVLSGIISSRTLLCVWWRCCKYFSTVEWAFRGESLALHIVILSHTDIIP